MKFEIVKIFTNHQPPQFLYKIISTEYQKKTIEWFSNELVENAVAYLSDLIIGDCELLFTGFPEFPNAIYKLDKKKELKKVYNSISDWEKIFSFNYPLIITPLHTYITNKNIFALVDVRRLYAGIQKERLTFEEIIERVEEVKSRWREKTKAGNKLKGRKVYFYFCNILYTDTDEVYWLSKENRLLKFCKVKEFANKIKGFNGQKKILKNIKDN